jgi:hypothetical protein
MAKTISFASGVQEFSLNGNVTVFFNPTDSAFINRVFDGVKALDEKENQYLAALNALEDNEQVFELASAHDSEAREIINGIFGDDVCAAIFGDMNISALADGLPVWANLLMAVIDTFDGEFAEEKKKTSPRVAKYSAKYSKRAK